MSQATIVRARQKSLEDLPEWLKCCESKRAKLLENDLSKEWLIKPSTRRLVSSKCVACGHFEKDVIVMDIVEVKGFICVDCFDFDEGPAEVTHDH